MESSLLLAIILSPLAEKLRQLILSVFSLNTLATRKERKTSSVSNIFVSQYYFAGATVQFWRVTPKKLTGEKAWGQRDFEGPPLNFQFSSVCGVSTGSLDSKSISPQKSEVRVFCSCFVFALSTAAVNSVVKRAGPPTGQRPSWPTHTV
jgi:hypothetical protein